MSTAKVCLAVVLFKQLHLVAAAVCPVFPKGSFHASAARKAMTCSHPASIKAASTSAGYISFSDLKLVSSSGATCGSELNELKAFVRTGSATMILGAASCDLLAIALTRSDTTATATAQIRMDFEKCTGGPSTASVLLDVVALPDATTPATMMPFWRQVCSVQTTTPAQSLAQLTLNFIETSVGNSSCPGSIIASYPNVDKTQCKQLCIADVQNYASSLKTLTTSKDMCKGYSFDTLGVPGTNVCHLHKGDVGAEADAAADAASGTFCWNLSAQAAQFHESTAAPPSQVELLEQEANLPKLDIDLAAHSANVLTFESTDKCFQPFNWITMQNYAAMALSTSSVAVKQSEWQELMMLIPSVRRLEAQDDLATTVLADRAIFGAPPATTAAPGEVQPLCAAPPAVPASMTMTFVLATVLVLSAAGGWFVNHGNPLKPSGAVAPQDPAAAPLVPPAAGPGPAGPSMGQ